MENRNEIWLMFYECSLDILGLNETKLRGEGEKKIGELEEQYLRLGKEDMRERIYHCC